MQRFFPDFDSLNRFTLNLNYHFDKLACRHCLKHDQFVSHGIVYKQRSIEVREKVGKRLFCSNRYGHKGCGRTFQLYVANQFPYLRYYATHLLAFITSLLMQTSVTTAYKNATGQPNSRHAWRWLNRLELKLSEFRTKLKVRLEYLSTRFHSRVRRLQVLLPTLNQLCSVFQANACTNYQMKQQIAFI